jgi:hypothetical protein
MKKMKLNRETVRLLTAKPGRIAGAFEQPTINAPTCDAYTCQTLKCGDPHCT